MRKVRSLSKARVQEILTRKLGLKEPRFFLRKLDGRVLGNIVSPTFKGKRDHHRLEMIWKALEDELGRDYIRLTGMFLAYTPDEWDLDPADFPILKRRKTGLGLKTAAPV